MEEEILNILERWMDQNSIPKEEQIKYYKNLIEKLEHEKQDLKLMMGKIAVSLSSIGIGMGLLFPKENDLNIYLGILSILFGSIIIIPSEKKEKEETNEIEEKRKLIKKWYIKEE